MKQYQIFIASSLLTTLLLTGCGNKPQNAPNNIATPVSVVELKKGSISKLINTTGTVQPTYGASQNAEMSGFYKLQTNPRTGKPFKMGDRVSKINELEFQEDKVDIELNIRQVWRNLENLRTQIKIAEQNVQNAQLTYDLNQTRYREGDITGMEMSQFQTQLSNKKITYTQALINYRIELLNLKILSLYDFDKNIPLVPMKDIIDKK